MNNIVVSEEGNAEELEKKINKIINANVLLSLDKIIKNGQGIDFIDFLENKKKSSN